VSAAEREPTVAAFACQMLLASDPEHLDGAADAEVFTPCAAAALYRREVFEEVDGFAALLYYPWRGQGRVVLRAELDALRGLPSVLGRRRLVQRGRRVDAWTVRRALRHGVLAPYVARYS